MMTSQKSWIDATDKQVLLANIPTDQSQLPERSMQDSLLKGVIPLSSGGKDRLKQVGFTV